MKNEAAPKGNNIKMCKSDVTEILPPYKLELCLELLLQAGSAGITQPNAYCAYHDSCLHSTISALHNCHDVKIMRRPDKSTVIHRRQKPFCRYWLMDANQHHKALNLLNYYRQKRGAEPLASDHFLVCEHKAA